VGLFQDVTQDFGQHFLDPIFVHTEEGYKRTAVTQTIKVKMQGFKILKTVPNMSFRVEVKQNNFFKSDFVIPVKVSALSLFLSLGFNLQCT
jgi:hypothetical protein